MPFFQSSSPSQNPNSSLRLPASKRISIPSAQRLITITEGQTANLEEAPPIPRRSSRRNSTPNSSRPSRWSGSTARTQRSAPPPYDWVPDPNPSDSRGEDSNLSEDEKLERLRGRGSETEKKRRGGWLRLGLIIGLVLLVVIALAVGLGVGLTRKKKSSGSEEQSSGSPDSNPPQKFPLGQYTLVTALKYEDYACTELPATWSCYPYTIYSPSTNTSSLASFDWIISNTSSMYATSSTSSTPDEGVLANLTMSTTFNPWAITFKDKPLTYVSTSTNASSARYTFSFTMPKKVIPSQPITTNGAATECYFNETIFAGTMYLSAPRNYPTNHSTSLAGYEQWPYAVEITQRAFGGTNVPNCYYTNDGNMGDQITFDLDPQPSTNECLCDYRNY